MFLHLHKKSDIIIKKDTAFQKEDDEMIVKPVNAGEKTAGNFQDSDSIRSGFSNPVSQSSFWGYRSIRDG